MSVTFRDNSQEVLNTLDKARQRTLESIGLLAEGYAKKLCPVGTIESTGKKGYRGGTLRNSITHVVDGHSVIIGSNVEYAPYVELGTGPYFTPPPEWEQFESSQGSGVGKGYVHPRPFLRPAVEEHKKEYAQIAKNEMGAGGSLK